MLRHRLSQLAVVPMLFLVLTGCSGSNCEPSQDIQSDSTEDAADTIDCPDGLVYWPEHGVCAPRVDECEAWEVPVVGGGCMAVGPRGCPKLWDHDADVDCEPGELLPCPEGFVETEDGVACVPVPPDLDLDMPAFDECPPGRLALEGGGCVQVGPRACPKLWDPDADVDCEVGDVLPCPDGWVESEDGMYCHPGWDECGHGEVPLVGGGCERVIPLPEDCPAGPFPAAPDGAADVLYVLADSPCTEGCGAEAAPYPSIQAAIDAAPSGAAVLVGPGTYAEGLTLTKPVHAIGLCASLVEVTGKALVLPDGDSKVLEAGVGIFDVQGVSLSGLRVRSPAAGVAIIGATGVVLEGLDITESHGVALYIDGSSDVDADDLWIHDTEPGSGQMGHGRGVWIGGGASLEAHSVLVEAARKTGIEVVGEATRLDLTDSVIRNTNPDSSEEFGRGMQAKEGCTVSVTGSMLEGNRDIGLAVFHSGTEVEVYGSVIRKTLPHENGKSGWGINAYERCTVSVAGSLLEENRSIGLAVFDPATEVEVSGSVIRKTMLDGNGEGGRGINASGGCTVSVAGSLLEENREVGLAVWDFGTEVDVSGSVIRRTLPNENGEFGWGIQAREGCAVSLAGSLLEENRDIGLAVRHSGTEVDVSGSVIRTTLPRENGESGRGINASGGCTVSVAGSLLEENGQIGLAVFHSGTEVEVSGSVIRKTMPDNDGMIGEGLLVQEGASGTVSWCRIEGNSTSGISVWGRSEGPGRRDPSLLHVENSAVLNTKKGGAIIPGGGYEVFGDGVFAGGGSELQLDSVVVMDNARAGAYYHKSAGGMSGTVIAGNGSYGLAMESCHQYVDYSDAFSFGNELEAVTKSPHGLPVPPPPEFDMEPLSPPRDLDE